MNIGRVENYLREKIKEKGCIHLVLLDPDKFYNKKLDKLCKVLEKTGIDAILVGGSTGVTEVITHSVIEEIKKYLPLPVIIFPSGLNSITSNADAIFYMSLLNSQTPYYLIEAQMLAAPIIKRYKLEAIPVAYLIIGEGEVVSYVGWARPLSPKHSSIVVSYAMAAEMIGFRMIYLEAGSGANSPIPENLVAKVRENTELKIIVGGGIRDAEIAKKIARAGADMIVTGTLVESFDDLDKLYEKLKSLNESISKI